MFNVEAVPGVSIVIRSKDPSFTPNNMVFVTEYAGMGSSPTSTRKFIVQRALLDVLGFLG